MTRLILVGLVGSILWLLYFRFRDRFLRAYGLFFLVLLVYASNKAAYGIPDEMSEGAFSPLSLVRWGLLAVMVFYALRERRPPQFRPDVPLGAFIVLLLLDILASSAYAGDFNYSFLRAVSFALLAVAVLSGLSSFLYWRENCHDFFQFHYSVAVIALVPMILLHLTGFDSFGVTIIMNQYAGLFGNQNMYGTFSALVTPYVLFHWRVTAQTARARMLDLGFLALLFLGIWRSGSRGGLLTFIVVVATYFFVVNLESRLKIVAVAACLLGGLMLFPSLKTDIDRFIKKDTAVAEARGSTSQLLEEKRYEMWSGVWPLFWREKLTGYGFASSHLLVFPFTRDKEAGRSIHNSYLETFGDLGLIGLSLLLLILYRILAKTLALIQRREDYRERNVNAVFIAILIAGLFNAFFESWMFSVGNLTSLLFWGPASGVVARWAWRPVEESPESGVQSPESWLGVHEREAISNETEKSKSETLVLTPESGGRTLD